MAGPDRLKLLLGQSVLDGVDFVYVHPDQVTLDVHFHIDPSAVVPSLVGTIGPGDVRIRSAVPKQSPLEVPLTPSLAWPVVDGVQVLRLTTTMPGGFSPYAIHISHAQIDPHFNDISFSFKANCETALDCRLREPSCPEPDLVDFPVDYLARDFWSYRRALLDFASTRYPKWHERLEADVGVMMTEVMSALGDEHAYLQDRMAREVFLETATQRRSVRHLTRLVDYDLHDGRGATTMVEVQCVPGLGGTVNAGDPVWAVAEDGTRVYFEIGGGLADTRSGKTFTVDSSRNSLAPHLWDEDEDCLDIGLTELYLEGHLAATLPLDDTPPGRPPGRWVLLETAPLDPAIEPRKHLVRLIEVEDTVDPLVVHPIFGNDVTRLRWEPEQALPFQMTLVERNLNTAETSIVFAVHGNVLPATAGETLRERFVIGPTFDLGTGEPREAVERTGPNATVAHLFSLAGSTTRDLVWLQSQGGDAEPELHLAQLRNTALGWVEDRSWDYRRSLVSSPASQSNDTHFTVEDGTYARVVGWNRVGGEVTHIDYAAGNGLTLRFGDGEFGTTPPRAAVFEVTYRLGGGTSANVSPGALRYFGGTWPFVESVRNPVAVVDGVAPEDVEDARRDAPEAFRQITYRAVRPEDYAEAAERLPWVQRAGAAFRWTGSWLTAFVTPDPRDVVELEEKPRVELEEQIDRFRQAGRPAHTQNPRYADIDMRIVVCVGPEAYVGDVKERVQEALVGRSGFFDEDNFTFGTPLERSSLEAAIQRVAGVRAVERIELRRRGRFDWREMKEYRFRVATNEVLRLENDAMYPDRGSLELQMRGGA